MVAHGSRREASNEEVRVLAAHLRSAVAGKFDDVESAFLELAEPSIERGIDNAVTRGAARVVVLPYFLVAGRHVATDIPAIVAAKTRQYPAIEIVLVDYFGAAPGIVDLLRSIAGSFGRS